MFFLAESSRILTPLFCLYTKHEATAISWLAVSLAQTLETKVVSKVNKIHLKAAVKLQKDDVLLLLERVRLAVRLVRLNT